MFERIFRVLALPCLFAILVSGSPGIYQDELVRGLRHASCPSCRRERPDALVSWYSEPVGEFRALEPDPWSRDNFQLDAPMYDRALRSRGSPPFRLRSPGEREDPFALEGDVNFDLAPAPTPSVRGLEGPREYQPRYQYPRPMPRPSYLKPSFYNKISRDPDLGRYDERYDFGSYEPRKYQARNYPVERPLVQPQNYPVQRPLVQPQNYPVHVERPLVPPQVYPRRPVVNIRTPEEYFLPREQPREPMMQVKDSYITPELSVYKTQNGKDEVSTWREVREEERQAWIEEYESQKRAKMAEEMRQSNGGRNGQFDSGDQEDMKGKRGAVNENTNVEVLGRSKVSWNRKPSTEVSSQEMAEAVTERVEDTKAVIVP